MTEPRMQREQGVSALQDLTGTSVGRFAIRARLGSGGMGEVYRADDTKLKRPVALKRIAPQLRADPVYRRRFLREAEYASQLSYEHIAGIYDVFEEGDDTFLVMEYVEGQTLRQRLNQPLDMPDFLAIATQCAAALMAAHERGIVHHDIKPGNIMISPQGQVKILDFGVARRLPGVDETASIDTRGSAPSGTPAYMPPEVLLEKESDGRGDIFSLGVVFYEALTGRNPFKADSFAGTTQRILSETPPPMQTINPAVPEELERIVAKMLAKDPAERYATAADLLVDLNALQRGRVQPLATPEHRVREAPWRMGPLWTATAAAALLAMTVAVPKVRQPLTRWLGINTVPLEKQLAVLPFAAVGDDTESAAFSRGLTETLTTKLTQLTATHHLQVISAAEVQARRITSAEEARKEFGVTMALEGSFLRSGDLVRVNFAVVDTRTRRQLRAESFTAAASDPFAVQDQVVDATLRMLDLDVPAEERRALDAHGTQVPGAYDFYLQGRGYLQNYDRPENLDSAIRVFQQALALDPKYALAYAGLGDAYWKKYETTKETRWVESSRDGCQRARDLDPNLAAVHICLGTLDSGTGQYEKATAEFERALELEPTNDAAYRRLGEAYARMGKLDAAEKTYRRAVQLRPEYWAGYNWLGVFYFHQARYGDAAQMFRQVVALAPDSSRGYSNLGAAYMDDGDYAAAIPVFEQSLAIRPTASAYSNLATAYFFQRRFAEAADQYREALKLNAADYTLWWNLGDACYWEPSKRGQAPDAYRKAITLAEEKLRVNSNDVDALGTAALCHAMLGEKEPSQRYLERALRLSPKDPELLLKAAQVNSQLNDTGAALGWLEKAIAGGISPIKVRDDPIFAKLAGNTKFQKLVRKP
jgi:tetratricopeptide (TPR) repeat protein/predicted Ser/Thr protein kinase